MRIIRINGKIEIDYMNGCKSIKIVQSDGYRIDLICRLKEASEHNYSIKISYRIDNADPIELYGIIDSKYNLIDDILAPVGIDYESILMVGNYNLYNELINQKERFLSMEIRFF